MSLVRALLLAFVAGCSASRGAAEPPATSPSVTPAPICGIELRSDAASRWPAELRSQGAVTPSDLRIETIADLDGDSVGESTLIDDRECGVTGNCPRLLYLSNAGCPRFAGFFWAAMISATPTTHAGVRDLELWLKGGCAGMEGSISQLVWNGSAYEEHDRIDCPCPEDERSPPVDPACPHVE